MARGSTKLDSTRGQRHSIYSWLLQGVYRMSLCKICLGRLSLMLLVPFLSFLCTHVLKQQP